MTDPLDDWFAKYAPGNKSGAAKSRANPAAAVTPGRNSPVTAKMQSQLDRIDRAIANRKEELKGSTIKRGLSALGDFLDPFEEGDDFTNELMKRRQKLQTELDTINRQGGVKKNEGAFDDIRSEVRESVGRFKTGAAFVANRAFGANTDALRESGEIDKEIAEESRTEETKRIRAGGVTGKQEDFGDRLYATMLGTTALATDVAATLPIVAAATALAPEAAFVAVGARVAPIIATRAPWILRTLGITAEQAATKAGAAQVGKLVVGTLAGKTVEGLQGGAYAGVEAEEQVAKQIDSNPEAFAASELGRQFLEQSGGDFDKARQLAIREVSGRVGLTTGIATSLLSLPGSAFEARVLGGMATKGVLKEAGIGAVSEGVLQEAPQSFSETVIANRGMQSVGSDVGTFEGAGRAALEGAALGSIVGGGLGAIGGGATPSERAPANPQEDTELISAISQERAATAQPDGGNRTLEAPDTVADREFAALDEQMGTLRVGGLNLTPSQIMASAQANNNNPRISNILSQQVSPQTKVEQVARVLNAEEATRAEPQVVQKITPLVGGKTKVSDTRAAIEQELSQIDAEVVAESPVLSAMAQVIQKNESGQYSMGGKQAVETLRNTVTGYRPVAPQGQTLFVRPERGGDGGVVMTQDQLPDERQRERQADQAFKLAERRQERYEQQTFTGGQREDLRPNAPEPKAEIFLNPEVYGEGLGGIAAQVVASENPGMVRIQYESPAEVGADGTPVIISEEVAPADLIGRVVRGTPRMTQDFTGDQRRPKRGVGTEMAGPRNSIDRTSSKSMTETPEPGLPMATPVEPNLRYEGSRPNNDQVDQPAQEQVTNQREAAPQQDALPAPQPKIEDQREGPTEAANDERYSGRTSKRQKRTYGVDGAQQNNAPTQENAQPTGETGQRAQTEQRTTAARQMNKETPDRWRAEPKEQPNYKAVIQDRLDKMAERGRQGKVAANRIRSLMKDKNLTARQLYYAFQMGEVLSRVLPKNAGIDILFVPSLTATDAQASENSATKLGEEIPGKVRIYDISQNGFRGLITMSLSESMLEVSRENAAHEAFHVVQDMLAVYDRPAFEAVTASFFDGMRIDDLDPSILRTLKTISLNGDTSVYDGLKADFGDTPFGSAYEAQAVAFGALVDAKDRGAKMKGLKASFIRIVDMLANFRRAVNNFFNKTNVQSLADIFDGYRTGEAQKNLTERAPLTTEGGMDGDQYSGRKTEKNVNARSLSTLQRRIPIASRVANKWTPGGLFRTVNGGKFSSLNLDKAGAGVKFTQKELNDIWEAAIAATDTDDNGEMGNLTRTLVEKLGMNPNTPAFWDAALKLQDRARYWYEVSAEAFRDLLPDLTDAELKTFIAIVAATSPVANPYQNMHRAVASMSNYLRGVPIDNDVVIPTTVREAIETGGLLEGLKTGSFGGTMQFVLGLNDTPPLSTNDRQVASTFNTSGDQIAQNPILYEFLSRFYEGIRDAINAKLPAGAQPYETWQLQALGWVEERNRADDVNDFDDYLMAITKQTNKRDRTRMGVLEILEDAGIDIKGGKLTRAILMDERVADALSPTSPTIRSRRVITAEINTVRTPLGQEARSLYEQAVQVGDNKAMKDYEALYASLLFNASRDKTNPFKVYLEALAGKKVGLTRVSTPTKNRPLDVGGSYNGVVSPNIRVPIDDVISEADMDFLLTSLSKQWDQDAVAAGQFLDAKMGEVREGYTTTYQLFVETTKPLTRDDMTEFLGALPAGVNVGYDSFPNGFGINLFPFDADFNLATPDEAAVAAAARSLSKLGKVVIKPVDFKSGGYGEIQNYNSRKKAWDSRLVDSYANKLYGKISFKKEIENGRQLTKAEIRSAIGGTAEETLRGVSDGNRKRLEGYRRRVEERRGLLAQAERIARGLITDPKDGRNAKLKKFVAANKARVEKKAAARKVETPVSQESQPKTEGYGEERYSARTGKPPKKTVTAYKLFRVDARKPGQLFPLFVNADQAVPMGEWLDAEDAPMAGGKVKSKIGPLAYRPGWHSGDLPIATHIGGKSDRALKKPDYRPENHVWAEVEMAADRDWQAEASKRGTNAQGKLVPVNAHITDQIPVDGFYRYKTNPNMTGNWLIGGSMRVNRTLTDDEVSAINEAAGVSDLPRQTPFDPAKYGFDGEQYSGRTGSAEFKNWFGDSKVVDKDGEPLVVYHGTSKDSAFKKFKVGPRGSWFTTDPVSASQYAEENDSQRLVMDEDNRPWGMKKVNTASRVIPAHLKIENPKVYTGNELRDAIFERGGNSYSRGEAALFRELVAAGHDGVQLTGNEGGDIWVVLRDPRQIKSVFNQEFDPKDERYSGRRGNYTGGVSESMMEKVVGNHEKAGVFSRFADKLFGRLPGESLRRAFVRNNVNSIDGGFMLDRLLDAKLRGVDISDGRVPVNGESVGRAMEMASQANGVMEAALVLGPPVYDNDLTMPHEDIPGLFEIFSPIGSMKADAFQTYAVARRESDLRRNGRVGFPELTDAEISETLNNADAEFAEVFEKYQEYNRAVIDYAIDTGLLTDELGDKFKSMDYVPYYRVLEDEAGDMDVLGTKMEKAINNPKSGLDLKLKGSDANLGNVYENIIRNTRSIIMASKRNLALQEAADAVDKLVELGVDDVGFRVQQPEGENIMRLRVDGKPVYYKIEDLTVWAAMAALRPQQRSSVLNFLARFTNVLRGGITLLPGFMIASTIRAKTSTYVTTDINLTGPIATIKGAKDAWQNGDITSLVKYNTGFGGYSYGQSESDFVDVIMRRYRRKDGDYTNGIQRYLDALMSGVSFLERTGEASEFAERNVLAQNLIDAGVPKKTAAYEAMNVTNYGRHGSGEGYIGELTSILIPLVPFLNARIQGLYRMAENQKNEKTLFGIRQKLLLRGLLYTAASTLIYAIMSEDDRWEAEKDETKMMYDILYFGDTRIQIPRPFEVGAFFGAMPAAFLDYARNNDGDQLWRRTKFAFLNTLGLNPTPQFAAPVLGAYFNYDTFTQRPIENMADLNLPAEMRYDINTSGVARGIGAATGASPKKVDFLIEGYLGSAGTLMTSMADAVLSNVGVIPKRPGGLAGDDYRIVDTAAEVAGITRFFKDSGVGSTRFVSQFYELKKEADQLSRAHKLMLEQGRYDEALQYLEDNRAPISARTQIGRIARQIGTINKQMDAVEMAGDLTPSQKKLKLKPLYAEKNRLARVGYEYARGMKVAYTFDDEEEEAVEE